MPLISLRLWSGSNPLFFQTVAKPGDGASAPSGYKFSRLTDASVLEQQIFSIRERASRMRARLQSNHHCYGFTTSSGEVVSFIWISIAEDESMEVPFRDGLSIRLNPGQAYVWDCATVASHQRRGLYRAGLQQALGLAARANAKDCYICTDEENVASVKGILGAGFERCFDLSLRRIGPIRQIGYAQKKALVLGRAPPVLLHPGTRSGPRIFVFGNSGYATMVLQSFMERNGHIVGVCSLGSGPWSRRLGRGASRLARTLGLDPRENFNHREVFDELERPSAVAHQAGIPVLDSRDIRTPEFEGFLRRLGPDLILVAGFHRLIPPNIIAVANRAAVNLHPSLLPRHRGGTPARWVVKLGERNTGATAHVLSPDFDTGDILAQSECPVFENDTSGDVELRVSHLMVYLANKVVDDLRSGDLRQHPQDEKLATYEAPFHSVYQEIDWSLPAGEILRTCYAMRPKSGGMAWYGDKRICVWDAETTTSSQSQQAGTVLEFDSHFQPVVACGDGALIVTEALWRGRVVPAAWISRKLGITPGERFRSISEIQPQSAGSAK